MKKIFLLDDEEKFAQIVQKNLERTGRYQVGIESSPARAVEALINFKPDVIILDIIMPNFLGYDIAGAIRNDKHLKDTPVFFLSALVPKGKKEIYGGLIDEYPFFAAPLLAKPARTEEIIEMIERSLIRRQLYLKDPVCRKCQKQLFNVNHADIEDGPDGSKILVHQNCDRTYFLTHLRE